MREKAQVLKGLKERKSGSDKRDRKQQKNAGSINNGDIAIIGVSCRFPGANDCNEFWKNLENGVDSITEVPSDRWEFDPYYSANPNETNASITKKGGLIDNAYSFDNRFFNISPAEAVNLDPQQRVFLEEAWRCIEDSGEPLAKLREMKTSVFVGATPLEFYNDINTPGLETNYYTAGGIYYFMIPNRVSYFLGLSGESKTVDTGCSSALVALHDAKLSLISGRSDYAMVAGVNMHLSAFKHIIWSKNRIISPDGKCKTFDQAGDGMVPGEGVGVLLLKPLKKAVEDNNHIYGVIKGISVNHGGKAASVSAPRVDAQRDVILAALQDAGIGADTVSYVEAHGTGTMLGDPIEVEGLTKAFRQYTSDTGFCKIGSVKTNIGHTISTAGIAGIIKVLLMLKAKKIPPSLHLTVSNPIIDFECTPFTIATQLCDWERQDKAIPLRAGVSSFGFGGVNSHVIIEEFKQEDYFQRPGEEGETELFALSAKTPESLRDMVSEWESYTNSEAFTANNLQDICFTLLTGRSAFPYRLGKPVKNKEQLKDYLKTFDISTAHKVSNCQRCLVIGEPSLKGYKKLKQGFKHSRFKSKLDELSKLLEKGGASVEITEGLYKDAWDENLKPLYLFMISYAFLAVILEAGFIPDTVAGKKAGIWTSLALSGVLGVEDVLMVLAGKKRIEDIKAARPKHPLVDPIGGSIIKPCYFDEGYLRLLLREIEINSTLLKSYADKARTIYENQYTFKKYIEEWEEEFKKYKLDLIKMLYDSQWLMSDASQLKKEKLLFLLAVMSSLKKLNKKWNLSQEKLLKDPRIYELLDLMIDDVLPKEMLVDLLVSGDPDYKAAVGFLNTRLQSVKLEGTYEILSGRNAALNEIGDVAAWIKVAAEKSGIPEVEGMSTVLFGESTGEDKENTTAAFDLQGEFERGYKQFLLDLWLNGVEVKWEALYTNRSCFRLSLPLYAFKREVFRLRQGTNRQESSVGRLHPLLDANVSTLEEQKFVLKLTGKEFFMSDHIVADKKTLPGAAYIEMARAAGALSGGKKVAKLKNIVWVKPITLDEGRKEVFISLYPGAGAVEFEMTARESRGEPALCAQGKLVYESADWKRDAGKCDLEQMKSRCVGYKQKQECYRMFDAMGLRYGEAFQPVEEIYLGQGEALARLELPSGLKNMFSEFILHPTLLDGALQAVVCLAAADVFQDRKPLYLPFTVGEVEIMEAVSTICYVHVSEEKANGNKGKDLQTFHVALLDEKGNELVRVKDFTVRVVEAGEEKQSSVTLAKSIWQNDPCSFIKDRHKWSGNILLLDIPQKLHSGFDKIKEEGLGVNMQLVCVKYGIAFEDHGGGRFTINSENSGDYEKLFALLKQQGLLPEKVILGCPVKDGGTTSDDLEKGLKASVFTAFRFVKSFLAVKPENPVRILFLYEESSRGNNPICAAMEGFFQTAMKENSKLSFKAIGAGSDLQSFHGNLMDCLLYEMYDDSAVGVRYTDAGRQIRINREEPTDTSENRLGPGLLKEGGVYLITGGAGGLGLIFAGHLTESYKAKVILTGRSQPGDDVKEKISKLHLNGGELLYIQADISQKGGVETLIEAIKQKYGELNGILHSAGVVKDAYIVNKSQSEMEAVLAPKVAGTVFLDEATKGENLDFFVMFSSVISILGNPGQCDYAYANSFMDHYSLLRESYRREGKRAGKTLSINWPLWKDGGMKVDDSTRILMEKTIGMKPMGTSAGLEAFEKGLMGEECSLIVIEGSKPKILSSLGILKEKGTAPMAVQGNPQGIDHKKLMEKLHEHLTGMISKILNVPKEEIDLDGDKSEYGFDSITINEFINHVNEEFGLDIIPPVFFEHSTVGAFARHLLERYSSHLAARYALETARMAAAGEDEGKGFEADAGINEDILVKNTGKELVAGVSKILKIDEKELDADMEISQFGFDSISLTEMSNYLNEIYNTSVMPSDFFEYPTLGGFAKYMVKKYRDKLTGFYGDTSREVKPLQRTRAAVQTWAKNNVTIPLESIPHLETVKEYENEPVAVIGISAKMPLSEDVDAFWNNILNGVDMVTEIPKDRWDWEKFYGDPLREPNKTNIKWGGFMKDADKFDAAFFEIPPMEAQLMDPQQRVFLETAWKAIEDAGYNVSDLSGSKTGVFVGVSTWDYSEQLALKQGDIQAHTSTGTVHSILANRISYLMNLHGPSEPVDTACSSSLVAVYRAVEALRAGDCHMAIAGGVNVISSPTLYISFSKAGMLSKDGRCKTFDKDANGYIRGEGAGAVILKPLSKAKADGDRIYAVIRGMAVNHGGHANSLTAPNPNAQAELIATAWKRAGIKPTRAAYIEAHGTGTSLGDPIEINGLKKAFEQLYNEWNLTGTAPDSCGIGSVKTNIGHLEAAAGIAGLIKLILAMKHGVIPGNLHFKEMNPYIKLEGSPFYIVNKNTLWESPKDEQNRPLPRCAGVSSFGFGGVNAHIVLEEYNDNRSAAEDTQNAPQVIVMSARNEERLRVYAQNLSSYLENTLSSAGNGNGSLHGHIRNNLAEIASTIMNVDVKEIDTEESLLESGMDYVGLTRFAGEINRRYSLDTSDRLLAEHGSIAAITAYLEKNHADRFDADWKPVGTKERENREEFNLTDIAYTLQVGRKPMEERLALVASSIDELKEKLHRFAQGEQDFEGLYRGSIKTAKAKSSPLVEGKVGEEFIKMILWEKDCGKLAYLWVNGVNIDWKMVHGELQARKISLPTYPFERKRYWISEGEGIKSEAGYGRVSPSLHPLIDENISDLQEQRYRKAFTGEEFYLTDHRVEGMNVLPGVAHLEMARAAGSLAGGRNVRRLRNITWVRPVKISEGMKEILISLYPSGTDAVFEIGTVSENGGRLVYSQGEICFEGQKETQDKGESIPVEDIRKRCTDRMTGEECYTLFGRAGIDYGSSFRVIREMSIGNGEVLTHLVPSGTVKTNTGGFGLHPAILDGAFQSVLGMFGSAQDNAYLPYNLQEIEIYREVAGECYVHVKPWGAAAGSERKVMRFDITVADRTGLICAAIKNLAVMQLKVRNAYEEATLSGLQSNMTVVEVFPDKVEDTVNRSMSSGTDGDEIDRNSLVRNLEKDLTRVICDILKLEEKEIDNETEFSRFGFDSITLSQFSTRISDKYSIHFMPSQLFELPNLGKLSKYLSEAHRQILSEYYRGKVKTVRKRENTAKIQTEQKRENRRFRQGMAGHSTHLSTAHTAEPIAIIGMSGVFPQSGDPEQFWDNLVSGKDMIREIPAERWDWKQHYGDPIKAGNKTNVIWGGFMNEVDKFDSAFFGISPKEAELMDPQQRIFLETVWKAIEDAGYRVSDLAGSQTGLFVGVGASDYYELLKDSGVDVQAQTSTGMAHSILANRISFLLDIHGPSEPIDTACSSSLVAVHRAIESIKNGDCDMAIAGGVNVILRPTYYISFSKAGFLSPDGKCKTFDKDANGYVRGEGCGAVMLKRLSRALEDGDHIYAVIKGSAINHGGRANSLTAPNPNAQADLIVKAWKKSGIDPATISYIESHGTGTSLGDPIEINGLKKAFEELYKGAGKKAPVVPHCGIGAVKTNTGHLETAAGMAGLIKILLSMKHAMIPGNLHFNTLNPYIQLEESPFYLTDENKEWKRLKDEEGNLVPRRAGISSFGFGGVNAHIVMEEYEEPNPSEPWEDEPLVFVLSAKKEDRLKAYCKELLHFLEKEGDRVSLESVAYTLQVGREPMAKRLAIVADTMEDLKKALSDFYNGKTDMENVYTGSVQDDRQKAGMVLGGRSGREFVRMLMDDKAYGNMAQLWVMGLEIEWEHLYLGEVPGKVSLPTYPFARTRHWVPEVKKKEGISQKPAKQISDAEAARILARRSLAPSKPEGKQDDKNGIFYYAPVWKQVPLEAGSLGESSSKAEGKIVIIYTPYASSLCSALSDFYPADRSIRIKLGSQNLQASQSEWEVDLWEPGAFSSCMESMGSIDRIYFLGGVQGTDLDTEDPVQLEESQQMGALSLFRLVRELGAKGYAKKALQLTVVTNNIYRVLPEDRIIPCAASLVGITKSISREYPAWSVALLDIDLCEINKEAEGEALAAAARAVVMEPSRPQAKEAALRGAKRYVRFVEPVRLPPIESSGFKKNGVYMILGGAGGIGLELGLYLGETVQANLVLMGRSELDAARMEKIAQIEAKGGKTIYLRADANNLESMKAAVAKAKEHFGRIDGVIHSAIVLQDKLIANMEEKEFRRALDTKVTGSLNLYKAVEAENPGFILFFSSAQSFVGNAGQSNYAAGCTFKDAFAYYLHGKCPAKVQIVNWGYWGSVGIVASEEYNKRLNERGIASIDPKEGFAALETVLGNRAVQVMPIKANKQLMEMMGADFAKQRIVFPWKMPALVDTALDMGKQPVPGEETLAKLGESFKNLERFADLLLLQGFRAMGFFQKAGEKYEIPELKEKLEFIPKYGRLYDEFINIFQKSGFISLEGTTVITSQRMETEELKEEIAALEYTKKHLETAYPAVKTHANLLWACSRHYPEIFTGKVRATDIMFPNSSMELVEGIYRGNDVADYYNGLVIWSLLSYIEARKATLAAGEKIKILEIGAGTGGTSAPVFKAISKYKEHLVYTYTDISMAFIHYGRQQFEAQNPYVEFKVLNVENDIKSQNYTPGDYDIIIATNVLHATKNIRNTLRNMKDLLKTNGWAVINEITHVQHVATMTFGLLDGWWLYEDEENRMKGSPLLKRETWERILKEEGFGRMEALGVHGAVDGGMDHNVFVAQSDGIVEWEADSSYFYEEAPSQAFRSEAAACETPSYPEPENEIPVQDKTPSGQKDFWDEAEIKPAVEDRITVCLAEVLKLTLSEFDCSLPFTDFGIDSILAVEVIDKINEELGIELKSTDLFNYSTVSRLAEHIVEAFKDVLLTGKGKNGADTLTQGQRPDDGDSQTEEEESVLGMLSMLEKGELDIDDVEKALWG